MNTLAFNFSLKFDKCISLIPTKLIFVTPIIGLCRHTQHVFSKFFRLEEQYSYINQYLSVYIFRCHQIEPMKFYYEKICAYHIIFDIKISNSAVIYLCYQGFIEESSRWNSRA